MNSTEVVGTGVSALVGGLLLAGLSAVIGGDDAPTKEMFVVGALVAGGLTALGFSEVNQAGVAAPVVDAQGNVLPPGTTSTTTTTSSSSTSGV